MKRISVSIILLLSICLVAVPVFAAQTASMTVTTSNLTVKHGDTFTVTVSINEVENCFSGGFMFRYDRNVFEYVKGSALVKGFAMSGITDMAGALSGYFMSISSTQTIQGAIFEATFKVKENAPSGTYTISGTPSLTTQIGGVKETLPCSVVDTDIAVYCEHSYGKPEMLDSEFHGKICEFCGDVQKASHHWNSGVVSKKATCKEEGIKTYICTDCGGAKAENIPVLNTHSYSNDCDAACNICGATRSTEHRYGSTWCMDETNHWYECSVCKNRDEMEAHTPGKEATESAPQTCTNCGYIIEPAIGHTHSYADSWMSNDDGHWHSCPGCNEKDSFTEHSFENACDPDCSVCGYTRQISHNVGEIWSADREHHWYTCTLCGSRQNVGAHEAGPEATPDSAQICTICGYEIVPAQGDAPTESPTDGSDSNSFPWWITPFLVLACIALVLLICIYKKKS